MEKTRSNSSNKPYRTPLTGSTGAIRVLSLTLTHVKLKDYSSKNLKELSGFPKVLLVEPLKPNLQQLILKRTRNLTLTKTWLIINENFNINSQY